MLLEELIFLFNFFIFFYYQVRFFFLLHIHVVVEKTEIFLLHIQWLVKKFKKNDFPYQKFTHILLVGCLII